jgi:hypothetical protein
MDELSHFRRFVAADHGLAVVSVTRADGSISSSVVNAGVLAHPVTGADVVGFVVQGRAYKRRRLVANPRTTVVIRAGWEWQAVEGPVELIGPLDPRPGVDVAKLLRDVFVAAGGTHEDWATYDRVMAEEQRTAVLVTPARVYGSPGT